MSVILSSGLVGGVVPRLVQTRRVGVFVLVLELFLEFALFLGCLPRVLGRSGRVGVGFLIHRDLLRTSAMAPVRVARIACVETLNTV